MKKAEFDEYWKFLSEFWYYLVGVALEGSKGKGWRGGLFVWPFVIALFIIIFLLVRALFF